MLTLRARAARATLLPNLGQEPPSHATASPRRARSRPPALVWIPALVVAVALALPLVYVVLRAMQGGEATWRVVFRPRTVTTLGNTALLAATVGLASTVLAVPLAWLTARTDLPGRRIWATVAALPLVIPSYVGALVVVAALGPRGLLQEALAGPIGIERLPPIYGFWGAWLSLTLFTYPYVFLNVQAALRGLDPALEEASRCFGYGPWRTFLGCTLPQLRPAMAAGALLAALYTVSDFGVVALLRYDALTWSIYRQYRAVFDRSAAAALALILVVFATALLLAEARVRGRAVYHRIGSGAARQPRPVPLGRWRYPALAYCAAVVGLTLGLPFSVLGYWLARDAAAGIDTSGLLPAVLGSATAGASAAVVATIAALPVALLVVRYPGRSGTVAERLSYLGSALPGIVLALAFVYFGVRTPIYQTVPLLILAYTVRFLPQAIGSTRLSLLQVSPRLEEAARNLGQTSVGTVARVTVPLARSGVLAGAALVFLTVVKELPITLLLRPTGFSTLATEIWTATGTGDLSAAAAPSVVLILLSALPTLLLAARDRASES